MANCEVKSTRTRGCLGRTSFAFITAMERGFYWHGSSVASRPKLYIVLCLVLTLLCSLGFLNFYMETRPEKLWIPQDSDYVTALEWQKAEFPNTVRVEMALYEAENVLSPIVIQEMYRIYKEVSRITVKDQFGESKNQTDLCFRVPVPGKSANLPPSLLMTSGGEAVKKDWSLVLNDRVYCGILELIPQSCLELGVLDVWGDNPSRIQGLTQQDIINDINTVHLSATYMYPLNFTKYLGGVERNSTGHIVSAKAALHQWMMMVNKTAFELASLNAMSGLATEVDPALYDWEGEFIRVLTNESLRPSGVSVLASAVRSFGEISENTIMGDVTFLVVGNIILYIYVTLMLGRFNFVEQRPLLSIIGISSTTMAVLISFGLCSGFGLDYGPVHSILPLLLLGLGVDDMFVIVQCWANLPDQDRRELEMKEQVGRALQHAGVAITVTSLTDMLAFSIGSTTALPALRSFCAYAALGVVALYLLQATFFVAWFYYDQSRMSKSKNGLVWCYTHSNYTPNECSQVDRCQQFFDTVFSRMILSKAGKVAVLLFTLGMTATAGWGVSSLRQEFNPVWFLPQSSYLYSFLTEAETYFPQAGTRGSVFLGALNYPSELPKIDSLTKAMLEDPDISSVDSWYLELANYTQARYKVDIRGRTLNESFLSQIMGKFIFSATGARFLTFFNFNGNISCGSDAPPILASKFDYQHGGMADRNQQIEAMDRTKALVANQNFSDFAAPVAVLYSSWETDKIIAVELLRNLTLSLLAVLAMTFLLISNFLTSLCVFFCVLLTLVDVMALMAWWDLTIDTVSCINLVLCVGLCVDYSAHVGLHFMQVEGTRDERVHKTLTEMAPPILNGAVSTFLAFVLLANSDSHVFISFFKIFFGVFIFGVFHGLVFLPVLLSLVGPASYSSYGKRPLLRPHLPELGPHLPQLGPQDEQVGDPKVAGSEDRGLFEAAEDDSSFQESLQFGSCQGLHAGIGGTAGIAANSQISPQRTEAANRYSLQPLIKTCYIEAHADENRLLKNEEVEMRMLMPADNQGNSETRGPLDISQEDDENLVQPNILASPAQCHPAAGHKSEDELSDENSDEEWKQHL